MESNPIDKLVSSDLDDSMSIPNSSKEGDTQKSQITSDYTQVSETISDMNIKGSEESVRGDDPKTNSIHLAHLDTCNRMTEKESPKAGTSHENNRADGNTKSDITSPANNKNTARSGEQDGSNKNKGNQKPQKNNQSKNKAAGNPNVVPPLRNADGYVRMNFLLQAAHLVEAIKIRKQNELANMQELKQSTSEGKEKHATSAKSSKSKTAEASRASRAARRIGGLSRGYIAYMKKLSSRLVNRLHPETKKATCSRCFSCLIPDGKFCARTRSRKRPSGLHVLETTCLACGHQNDRIIGVLKHVELHDSKAEDDKHVITIAPRQSKEAPSKQEKEE